MTTVTYTLTEAAIALAALANTPELRNTVQGNEDAALRGSKWRNNGHQRQLPNTRAAALAAIQAAAAGKPITAEAAQAALAPLHAKRLLGTGTPRSYVKAFFAKGQYLAEVKVAPEGDAPKAKRSK